MDWAVTDEASDLPHLLPVLFVNTDGRSGRG